MSRQRKESNNYKKKKIQVKTIGKGITQEWRWKIIESQDLMWNGETRLPHKNNKYANKTKILPPQI